MVTASAASDFDQDWVNIASRFNGGNAVTGNVTLDWWFYDPTGSGNSNYRDYAALAYYNSANGTGSLDYPTSTGGNLNPGGSLQRLSLGTQTRLASTTPSIRRGLIARPMVRQADSGLTSAHSVGWHEGTIILGPPNGASTLVSFFIDGTDVLDHNIATTNGVNVIEVNDGFGSTVGNFDDFSLSMVPEPASFLLLVTAVAAGGIRRLGAG